MSDSLPLLGESEIRIPLDPLEISGINTLLLQHVSSAWGDRMAEFAVHLNLIVFFRTTLLPNALYGFICAIANIVLSRWLGSLVDRYPKLPLVRACILVQKASSLGAYGSFICLFAIYEINNGEYSPLFSGPNILLGAIIFCGCALQASTTCIAIIVQRDWVTCIAMGNPEHLSSLNARLKRIDLVCKMVAPLFVSLLTTFMPYLWGAVCMAAVVAASMVIELVWISFVYRALPALARDQARKDTALALMPNGLNTGPPLRSAVRGFIYRAFSEWYQFLRLPVFLSSVAVSFLHMTVLSFDGTMLSYLKTQGYTDGFLASMRALNVLAGLLGTATASWIERKVGSVRGGNWSIWAEFVCLIPVVVALLLGNGKMGAMDAVLTVMLFGGMALSRIGLWSFDLIQVKQLQISLEQHPQRNTLTSLQFSLQNTADLIKYILAMVFSSPAEFRWIALASFISVFFGATTYSVYVFKERGHLFHLEWLIRKNF
ncbi:hypothetical protein BS47DRAFT_1318902 [Hydnum rufescens UP504]|uniref:Solute carrier family 40 member n=1 Tax=Hydnum rufescens UP504 TaxID=1448309 RepID=A0A9P6AT45_9AGAM|nr:hypothetical protein BS47DRAFT_1318902 [Hydnum rufescens UP504]